MSENHEKRSSTSSSQMEASPRSDEILALGCRLTKELGLDRTDTLGRWMAHFVAELIDNASIAPPPKRTAAQKKCFDAILQLWAHRSDFPAGRRPFEAMEPVIRAVSSLDPGSDTHRYVVPLITRTGTTDQDQDPKSNTWLEAAENADYAARLLISFALGKAAKAAVDQSAEWIKLARAAGQEIGPSEIIVRLMSFTDRANGGEDDGQKVLLRKRIERLDRLSELTQAAKSEMSGAPAQPGSTTVKRSRKSKLRRS